MGNSGGRREGDLSGNRVGGEGLLFSSDVRE